MKVSNAIILAAPALAHLVVRQADTDSGYVVTATLSSVAAQSTTVVSMASEPSNSMASGTVTSMAESSYPLPSTIATIVPLNSTMPTTTMIVPPYQSGNSTSMYNSTGMPGTGLSTSLQTPPQSTTTVTGGGSGGGSGGATTTTTGSTSVPTSGATLNSVSLLGIVAGLAAFML